MILDANGNPVSSDTPTTNGLSLEPIDQIPPIPDEALQAVIVQSNQALSAGAALNMPVGVDLGLLASLARTVRDQRKMLAALQGETNTDEIVEKTGDSTDA